MTIFLSLLWAFSSVNNGLPPLKYQGNAVPVVIVTVDDTNSNKTCGKAPKGYITLGCEQEYKGVPVIMMPNPCLAHEAVDDTTYAHLLCHEMGHANGWNATHDN